VSSLVIGLPAQDVWDVWEGGDHRQDVANTSVWTGGVVLTSALSSSDDDSLARYFLSVLPGDERIERVYWATEGAMLRVWTVIDEPDEELEGKIYDAQLRFLDHHDDRPSDFSVVYRFGRSHDDIRPERVARIH
jgi:hypothetical protein